MGGINSLNSCTLKLLLQALWRPSFTMLCPTTNGDGLLWAMATLGFEDYIEPLKSYLTRYREVKN
ncbi:putative transcription factor Hap3/NF-YB family [Helianthus anomalus]